MTAPIRVLTLPCVDELMAESFAGWLRREEVDGVSVDGRDVRVPTDNPLFAWDLAEAAVEHEWAHDDEVCAAVGAFLEEAGCP